jgi:hypothetical protein
MMLEWCPEDDPISSYWLSTTSISSVPDHEPMHTIAGAALERQLYKYVDIGD